MHAVVAADVVGDWRRLRRGSALAGAGDGIAAAALPLLAAELTRDPLAVAGVIAAQHLPWALTALVGTRLAGMDRRTVVGAADAVRAVAIGWLGLLVLAGAETLTAIQLTALAVGAGEALTDDAEQEVATDAGSLGAMTSRGLAGVAVVGLPLGGLLYEIFPATPLVVGVLVYALAGLYGLMLRAGVGVAATDGTSEGSALHLPAGTRALTAVAVLSTGATSAVLGILVLFAVDDLELGAPAFGLLLGGLAVAAGLGGMVAPELGRLSGLRLGLVLSLAAAAAGYAAAASLADPGLPVLSALGLAAATAGSMAAAVLVRALLLARSGRRPALPLRGFHAAVWAAIVVGALAGGLVARQQSVVATLWMAAGVAAVGALAAGTTATREIG